MSFHPDEKLGDSAISATATPPNEFADVDGVDDVDDVESDADLKADRRLVRKLDLHIMTLAMLIYIFSVLDRVNIGNAALYGLKTDLGLVGNQYQILVSILFATYISVEIPANWMVKRIGPSRWLGFITAGWGLVATFSGFAQTFGSFLACRLLLGALEGGLWPGLVVYLTTFYTRREIALRIAVLFACSALAGAGGGLLAFGIGFLEGHGGYNGWRWIMILEGLPCIVLGVATWFGLADEPATAYYLTPAERARLVRRLDRQPGMTQAAKQFHWNDALEAFADWTVWAFCFAQFGADVMLYAFSAYLPTIIKGINADFSTPVVQVLTIPCYLVGAAAYLVVGQVSDRIQHRALFVLVAGVITVCGYGMLISDGGVAVHYAGCFLVAAGLYIVVGLPLAWLPTNVPRYGKRTTTIAMQACIGNSAGIMSGYVYPAAEGPRYVKGHAISLAMGAFAVVTYGLVWAYYVYENKQRTAGKRDARISGLTDDQVRELGDKSPHFIFAT
ncbi:MFS transporter [Sporothrix brasiliensis 5110]|uniref:MFS transporter n=1 Tax=Sporothrix brasiliensis 5110 TaxID=1398154 RepID=A0A0C2FAL6_9PEZI|nr:MFS transporter [Sporothrix brasiliensis 5110]KIH88118.1 MFS transporter [Sporothrix brasiliensis 5110]